MVVTLSLRFRTGRGLGYSAHFVGSNIVIETVSKNARKPQTYPVEWVFDSYKVRVYVHAHACVHVLYIIPVHVLYVHS